VRIYHLPLRPLPRTESGGRKALVCYKPWVHLGVKSFNNNICTKDKMWYTISRNLSKDFLKGDKDMIIGSIFMILIIPLILIFALGVPILLAVLVYRDANKRVDCSPWLWALVAALVPSFIGVIVYLIIRRDYPLKPEYRIYEAGSAGQYRYEQGSQEYSQAQKGMPTWAKALIIIGLVIFAICIIGMVVSVINYITGYSTGYHYHNDFGYGF